MNEKFTNNSRTNSAEMLLKKVQTIAHPHPHSLTRCHGTTTGGGINEIIILEKMQIMSRHRKFHNFVSIFPAKIFIIPPNSMPKITM